MRSAEPALKLAQPKKKCEQIQLEGLLLKVRPRDLIYND